MIGVAPAKVILSGEHAVVYGAPALAVAVRRYARVASLPALHAGQLTLELPDLNLAVHYDYAQLAAEATQSRVRYAAFLDGRLPIGDVVSPAQLLLAALVELIGDTSERWPERGLRFAVRSDIPPGAGMGSSAAVVAALLRVAATRLDITIDTPALWRKVVAAEQLQHGRSSGLDPAVCLWGGVIEYRQGRCRPLAAELPGKWRLVASGAPLSATGECVEQVRCGFAASDIWAQFAATTTALGQALSERDPLALRDQLQANHRLLCRIGVVPAPVQRFIQHVEQLGGAAKICGAGAVRGDAGGMILVYHPEAVRLPPLPVGYATLDMELDFDGARVRS